MSTYQLVFADDGRGLAKTIEFDAVDAAAALEIAHSEAPRRNAELWQDNALLCRIKRSETGFWNLT